MSFFLKDAVVQIMTLHLTLTVARGVECQTKMRDSVPLRNWIKNPLTPHQHLARLTCHSSVCERTGIESIKPSPNGIQTFFLSILNENSQNSDSHSMAIHKQKQKKKNLQDLNKRTVHLTA